MAEHGRGPCQPRCDAHCPRKKGEALDDGSTYAQRQCSWFPGRRDVRLWRRPVALHVAMRCDQAIHDVACPDESSESMSKPENGRRGLGDTQIGTGKDLCDPILRRVVLVLGPFPFRSARPRRRDLMRVKVAAWPGRAPCFWIPSFRALQSRSSLQSRHDTAGHRQQVSRVPAARLERSRGEILLAGTHTLSSQCVLRQAEQPE